MPIDSLSLKKIKTAQIGLSYPYISASSFNSIIRRANRTVPPNHYFNNCMNKYMNTKQTAKKNRGKIYLWSNLPMVKFTVVKFISDS